MTTASYIAVSTEFLTCLHFALTSSPPAEQEFPFFALLTFLAGSPKHITLGLLQHFPMGRGISIKTHRLWLHTSHEHPHLVSTPDFKRDSQVAGIAVSTFLGSPDWASSMRRRANRVCSVNFTVHPRELGLHTAYRLWMSKQCGPPQI